MTAMEMESLRRCGLGLLGVLVALLATAGGLQAQQADRDCVLGAGGGVRIAPPDSVLTGDPTNDWIATVEHGGVFRLDLACPLGDGGLRIGGGLESEAMVETLALHRLLVIGRLDVSRAIDLSVPWRAEAVAVAGWTAGALAGGGLLVAPSEGKGIEPKSSGPTVGLGVRFARHLTGALSLDLRAEWRATLLEDSEFSVSRGIFARKSRPLVHTFPVTVGLALEL